MKRLTCLLLLLALLTGCAQAPQDVQAPPAPVVVTLWHSYQGEALKGLEQAQKELANTNPPYQLQLVYVSPDKYWTDVSRAQAAGKGPDILLAPQEQLPALYVEGVIQPLDNLFDPSKFFKSSLDALTFNGSILAIPKSIRVPLLVYNRDLVPDQPSSLEQLLDRAGKISQGKTVGLTGDLSNNYLNEQIFSAFGGQLFTSDQKPNLNSPEALGFLQQITGLTGIKSGIYDAPSAKDQIGSGTTPFGLMDSSELAAYKGLGKNLGFMEIPGPGGKEGKPYIKAEGFAISTNCNFPKQAAAIALYLSSQPALAKYSIPQGELPAEIASYDQKPLVSNPEAQLVKHLAAIGSGYPLDSRSNLLLPIFSQSIKDVLNGTAPTDAAANAQTKAIQALGLDKP